MKKRIAKHLPTIKFNKYVYIGIAVLFVLLLGGLQRQKDGGIKVWDTMLIMGNYDQKVELSTEERSGYEAEVQKYDELIASFILGTGKDMGNRTKTELEWFLAKAENLNFLGQNNQAIKTLIAAYKYFPESTYIMDLLAAIYAEAGAYQRALTLFEKIVQLVPDSKMGYAKPIMEMYVRLGEVDTAGKLYIEYIKNWWAEDTKLVNMIRVARGLDPM